MNKITRNLVSVILLMELFDATMLYVALPKITLGFGGLLFDGDWIIIGFMLAMALSMLIASWFVSLIGMKKAFLISQAGYILTSLACGFSNNLDQLITFRILQGVFAGVIVPIGIDYWIRASDQTQHKSIGNRLYLYEMTLALTLGPLYAGYIVSFIEWRALFFIKVPISIVCFFLSWFLLKEYEIEEKKGFHWRGFLLFSLAIYFLVFSITELCDLSTPYYISIITFLVAFALIVGFVKYELTHKNPIINFHLFKNLQFSLGIFLQSIVMIVFMGAIFILALFLIGVQKFDIIDTAWIIAALGLGLGSALFSMRVIRNFIPDIILIAFSLIFLAISMYLLTKISRETSKFLIASVVFLEGFSAGVFRVVNTTLLFNQTIAKNNLEDAGKIITFINQLMITIGVAATVMIVELNLDLHHISNLSWATPEAAKSAYQFVFYFLTTLPIIGIITLVIARLNLKTDRLK